MKTVAEAVSDFHLANKADGLTPATQRWYASRLTPFADRFGCATVESVTTAHMRQYIIALRERSQRYENATQRPVIDGGLSVETLHGHIRALRRFWKWAIVEYGIKVNPMTGIRLPKLPNREPKSIALEDLKRLLAATDDSDIGLRNRAMLLFMIDTGCRAGGLLSLKMADLNIDEGFARVIEKGNIQRAVFFCRLTKDVLARWFLVRPKVEHVFCNLGPGLRYHGAALTLAGLHYMLKKLKKASGVKGRINPHSFRHAFARIVLDNGSDLASLAELMGHRDPRITIRYYARYTRQELAQKHARFSPVTNLEE